MKRWVTYVLIAIATATFLILGPLGLTNATQRVTVPEVLKACLPPSPSWLGQYEFDVAGRVNNPNPQVTGKRPMQEFYLLDVLSPWEGEHDLPWQTLIGVDTNGQCFGYIGQNAMNVTLTAYMPVDLANAIAFQKFSHLLMHPNGKAWIEALLKVETIDEDSKVPSSPEPTWLAPEDAWALQKLGYQIPAEARILETLTPYQFDS